MTKPDMSDTVIVEAVRTPVGKRDGNLSGVHPTVLAANILTEIVRRTGIDPLHIDDIIMGCVSAVGDQALNIGRNSALLAGLPKEVPAMTIDRQCGSSQEAVHLASSKIASGTSGVVIAAGVESMSRVPMGSTRANGPGSPFTDDLKQRYPMTSMGIAAESIAETWQLSRESLDAYSLRSHELAARAQEKGFFKTEIMSIEVYENGTSRTVRSDDGIRFDTSMQKLGNLKTPFKDDGVVTAGNSSQISDGAAGILLMDKHKALELGLTPRARIVGQLAIGADPVLGLSGPIPATRRLLEKTGINLGDIDLFEVNEAFASVVLAWETDIGVTMDRVNVNGGAIALGHPLGASGARIMTTLLHELERRDARLGLQTMCCFGGLGLATIIERI